MTVAEIAEPEGWSPDRFAIATNSEGIRDSRIGLDTQREWLAALAKVGIGMDGDQASAEELARHLSTSEALFLWPPT